MGFTIDGTHAEYVLRGVDEISPSPSNLTPTETAACGLPFVTAFTALCDRAAVKADDVVVIIGAAGAVGSTAVQVAIHRKAKVIGVVRREEQAKAIDRLGCIPLVDAEGERLGDAVREITPDGASLIFDTVGGNMMRSALAALSTGGRLVEIAAPEGQREVTFDLLDFYRRDLKLIGVNTVNLDAATCSKVLSTLGQWVEAGQLRVPSIDRTVGLDAAPAAYREAAARKGGKTVIEF
jgi:NADPH:quinone reductase-like Zn-dependent oxidoreductase